MDVVKTQYIYVNTANRVNSNNTAYKYTLSIPGGIFMCDNPRQRFRVTIENFNMVSSWYFVNQTNNTFTVVQSSLASIDDIISEIDFTIPDGNYTFKGLAATIQQLIQNSYSGVLVSWDNKTNKLVFTFPTTSKWFISFDRLENPAKFPMGLIDDNIYSNINGVITSQVPLSSTLSKNIMLYCDNLSPMKDSLSVQTKNSELCEPTNALLSIVNNFSPFDIIKFENNNNLYSLHVCEKTLENLTFSIKDENGNLLRYVSDWNASIRIDTLQDAGFETSLMDEIRSIKDYLRMMFLQAGM